MKEIEIKAIEKYGAMNQTMVAIEEMAELMQALVKCLRGKKDRNNLVEEIADVQIMLDQVMMIHGIELNEVIRVMEEKTQRLKERMENESV
jgi:phosphoribosyl-ATP pyrophosphohydrolase